MSPNKEAPAAVRPATGAASARNAQKAIEFTVGQALLYPLAGGMECSGCGLTSLATAVVGHAFAGGDSHG